MNQSKFCLCPDCGSQVLEKVANGNIVRIEASGERHTCRSMLKPIGQLVTGQTIESFQLRDRRVTMQLSGMVLEIHAKGNPLSIRLVSPNGTLEE